MTNDERRERYEGAIKGALPLADRAVTRAMAVADEEREEERSEFAEMMQQRDFQGEEDAGRIAALRAERDAALDRAIKHAGTADRLRAELEDVRGHHHRAVKDRNEHYRTTVALRAELSQVRAATLREAADEADRFDGTATSQELRRAAGQVPAPCCTCEPMEYGNGPDNTHCRVHGQVPAPQEGENR